MIIYSVPTEAKQIQKCIQNNHTYNLMYDTGMSTSHSFDLLVCESNEYFIIKVEISPYVHGSEFINSAYNGCQVPRKAGIYFCLFLPSTIQ